MKVEILKDENDEAFGLYFNPENDDESKILKELWGFNKFSLHRSTYKEIGGKVKGVSFWMNKEE